MAKVVEWMAGMWIVEWLVLGLSVCIFAYNAHRAILSFKRVKHMQRDKTQQRTFKG